MFAETRSHPAVDSVSAVSTRDPHEVVPLGSDASAVAPSSAPASAGSSGPTSTTGSTESSDPIEELQRKIYDLVKARVLQSIGAGANWTISFRSSADTDTFFSDTMADMIAWDVAHQLIGPSVPNRARLAS